MKKEDLVREYAKSKDPKLREQIIIGFMPIIKYVIARMNLAVRNKTELEDIHSAGIFGLLRAMEDFDLSNNTAFATYATWRIRGNILDYLRKIDIISRGDRAKIKQIETTIGNLTLRNNREPSAFEISNELGLDLKECHRVFELVQLNFTISLDQIQYFDGEEVKLSDVIADETWISPLDEVNRENILKLVTDAILRLPERQRMIVVMYYNDEMTLLEIGKTLNLSESRISILLGKAILTIRNELKSMKVQIP